MSGPQNQAPDTGELCRRYPSLVPLQGDLQRAYEILRQCVADNHTILVCGNGGSASDAEHIVGELMKSCAWKRPIPPADRAGLLALSSDSGPLADALEVGI